MRVHPTFTAGFIGCTESTTGKLLYARPRLILLPRRPRDWQPELRLRCWHHVRPRCVYPSRHDALWHVRHYDVPGGHHVLRRVTLDEEHGHDVLGRWNHLVPPESRVEYVRLHGRDLHLDGYWRRRWLHFALRRIVSGPMCGRTADLGHLRRRLRRIVPGPMCSNTGPAHGRRRRCKQRRGRARPHHCDHHVHHFSHNLGRTRAVLLLQAEGAAR